MSLVGGRYQLIERIGKGGMAEVFRATDVPTGALVAVKRMFFSDDEKPSESRRRFEQEIIITRQLKHSNIVRVMDSGVDETGVYLVMELLSGTPLSRLLRGGARFEWPRAVAIARQLCGAMSTMHGQGIVHRDLKLSNVIVEQAGSEHERAVLIDFGIARGAGQAQLTSAGMMLGTLEFCPPEQINGLLVDHRADLYAFGVMLYRMLAGKMPFEGKEFAAIIYAHFHSPPPLVRAAAPKTPEALEALIVRCLAKDPSNRPADAASIEALLSQVRADPPPASGVTAFGSAAPSTFNAAGRPVDELLTFKDVSVGSSPLPVEVVVPRVSLHAASVRLLKASGQSSAEHRAVTLLAWGARLMPFFDEEHVAVQRVHRFLEKALGELVEEKGVVRITAAEGRLLVGDEVVSLRYEQGDLADGLSAFFSTRGLQGVVFHGKPTLADVQELSRVFRGSRARPTTPNVEILWAQTPQTAQRSNSPIAVWEQVSTAIDGFVRQATHGVPFDTLTALHLADLVFDEVRRPGRRSLGVIGTFSGTSALSAQATNVALLSAALASDRGLSKEHVRDVAHLAIATSVSVLQVYPVAYVQLDRLNEEERGVLQQAPLKMIREALSEVVMGPALWRRVLLAFELMTEMARGLPAVASLPEPEHSALTSIVFGAMAYWGLRVPRSPHRAMSHDEALATMRGALRGRLDQAVVDAIEHAMRSSTTSPVEGRVAGAQVALLGLTPAEPPVREGAVNQRLDPLVSLVISLVGAGLESEERVLPLLFPILETLVMQDEHAAIDWLVSQLAVKHPDMSRRLIGHLVQEDCLVLLTQILNDSAPRNSRAFAGLMRRLDITRLPALVRLIAEVNKPESEAALIDVIAEKVTKDGSVVVAAARSGDERRGDKMLRILARAHDSTTMSLVHKAWESANLARRCELLEIAGDEGSKEAFALVTSAASQRDPALRLAAFRVLGTSVASQAAGPLLDLLRASDFAFRPDDERSAAYAALAMRPEAPAVRYLGEMAAERPPFLGKSGFVEERKLFITSLVSAATVLAFQTLIAVANDEKQAAALRSLAKAGAATVRRSMTEVRK